MGRTNKAMGFLTRLRKDVRGNALAIMAAAIIPLAGLVGGGIDLSRMYIVKTRLQHACDAGALAGRKAMGGGTWDQSNYLPRTTANNMFAANFLTGSYGGITPTEAFSESAGKVTGTASAPVPMTLMRIFGKMSATMSVACDAEMRLPNTDVMFVLDNTGSMSDTLSGDTQSKIAALRNAVKCFYETVAKLPTNGNCGTKPSGGLGGDVQMRFGFVPYDMNVRVGRLLPTEYFANSWPYQSRKATTVDGTFRSWDGTTTQAAGSWSGYQNTTTSRSTNSQNNCSASLIPIPSDSYALNGNVSATWPDQESATGWRAYAGTTQTNYKLTYNNSTQVCWLQSRTRTIERRAFWDRVPSTPANPNALHFPAWLYTKTTLDVSGLKAGSGVNWNSGVTLPIGKNYANTTLSWDGCIEERKTAPHTTYDPIPSDTRDLDIDGVPSAGDSDSLWGPALKGAIFPRTNSYTNSGTYGAYTTDDVTTFTQTNAGSGMSYTCPVAAHKLEVWDNPTTFDTYVDSMQPGGNTYHDIGLLWGARLMSPTGIFASENAYTQKGGEIQRHLILMTDGDACTFSRNYQAYGIGWWDRRETDPSVDPGTQNPTCSSDTDGILTKQVEARTAALCTAVKNKNITLWVIYFGPATGSSTAAVRTEMTACASPGRFYQATNSSSLLSTFANIANQISQLRLTK